jgi:type IV secretory pathway ATPase VirB11/archaellum biosynthesis ATPase
VSLQVDLGWKLQAGEHSPEECLNSALRSATDFIIIDGVDDQSEIRSLRLSEDVWKMKRRFPEKQKEGNATCWKR